MREAFPGYRAGVVAASGLTNGPSVEPGQPLRCAPLDHPHLLAWREAFRAFGAKPKRHHCSAEALIRRVAGGGGLPPINRLVDLYNAVSVRWAVPVGGEDVDRVEGAVRLRHATGDEPFDGDDPPRPGEVVWADAAGVTCRRWNWRQGRRTRLELGTTCAYFLFDALAVFEELDAAMDDLEGSLRAGWPAAQIARWVVA